ncbi:TRAP transporter small permease [Agrococcus sp. TSP3-2-1]|uniref:TRAP transporter small permease n=1 Tax=Agrococcus sp. TSP3-2-1 TaxID=2804583 RepID=UPI003CEFE3F9
MGSEFGLGLVLLVGLLSLVILQVMSRYVFASPFSWTEELARFVFIWMVFAGAAFVTARRRHIAVQLYGGGRTGKVVGVVEAIATVIVIATAVAMAIGAAELMQATARLTSPGTNVSLPVVYASAVVGFALIAFHSVCNLYLTIRYPSQFAGSIDIEKGGI